MIHVVFSVWADENRLDDWYSLTTERVLHILGGPGLLQHYITFSKALETVYPEFEWQLWRFPITPRVCSP